jgi:hypothetical protein
LEVSTGKDYQLVKSRFTCCRGKAKSAKVKRRMYAKCDRSSTLPMSFKAHSTDMGEIEIKNNAANAIPEIWPYLQGGGNRFPSKMERRKYARYNREKEEVCAVGEERQVKGDKKVYSE